MSRWACVDDLKNYFRKSDLLKGLTEEELAVIRENLGIVLVNEELGLTEITYEHLLRKIKNNQLTAGALYLITDYLTIYSSNVLLNNGTYETWGDRINPSPIMPLLVKAVSKNLLDPRVIYTERPDWIIEYDVKLKILDDGNKNKGTITYLKDNHNNSAYYDFKHVKFKRDRLIYYTFSDIDGGRIVDNSESDLVLDNTLGEGCWNNIFLGCTKYNIFYPDCQGNTFFEDCHDNVFQWKTVNNTFRTPVCYLTGSLYGIDIQEGDTTLSTTITKTIHKSNDRTLVVYLDPITYALLYSLI